MMFKINLFKLVNNKMNKLVPMVLILLILSSCISAKKNPSKTENNALENNEEWQPLFNGKDLKDWTVKIHHHELGDNYANTFRVTDGVIQVNYDG